MNNMLSSPDYELVPISKEERSWLDVLPTMISFECKISQLDFRFYFMENAIKHPDFNPFKCNLYYIQEDHIGEKENISNTKTLNNGSYKGYYVNQPMYRPTAKIIIGRAYQSILYIKNGILDNKDGEAAVQLFHNYNLYFLNGEQFEPLDYFDKLKNIYRYDPEKTFMIEQKYKEFMAEKLGEKLKEQD